jgi:magnesium transporter
LFYPFQARRHNHIEKQLYKSLKNKELIQLLALEKSLVYFTTSLKADDVTLEKVMRGRIIKLYEEDQDLLEDVIIEIKQAIEMTNIYSSILTGTMDAFASVISNNLNIIMKVLTVITILMTIPTITFSYYGMNVDGLPVAVWWFPIVLAAGITFIGWLILRNRRLY